MRYQMKKALYGIAFLMILAGFVTIGVAGFSLHRLDNTWGGDPSAFDAAAARDGTIAFAGVAACLLGCIVSALTMEHRRAVRGGKILLAVAFATLVFGFFFLPIHFAIGALYLPLVGLTFGACLTFFFAALIRYVCSRIHLGRSNRAERKLS